MRLLSEHDILGIHPVYVPTLTEVVTNIIRSHTEDSSWSTLLSPTLLVDEGLSFEIVCGIAGWLRETLLDNNHQEPFSSLLLLIVGRVTFIAGGYFGVMSDLIGEEIAKIKESDEVEIPTIKSAI